MKNRMIKRIVATTFTGIFLSGCAGFAGFKTGQDCSCRDLCGSIDREFATDIPVTARWKISENETKGIIGPCWCFATEEDMEKVLEAAEEPPPSDPSK